MSKPVIFLAFANDKEDNARYLRNLPKELQDIREALKEAEIQGLCEVIAFQAVDIKFIFDTFQDIRYKNRIAIFHFGGHADGYQLLLEGVNKIAHGEGLVKFLASFKENLKLAFFNGCATEQLAKDLVEAGLPSAIGTYSSINDEVATSLAVRFYKGIASGFSIESAWNHAIHEIETIHSKEQIQRGLYRKEAINSQNSKFLWDIHFHQSEKGAEAKEWSLQHTSENPVTHQNKIPPYHQYTCDRVNQNDKFKVQDLKKEKLNFFYLHGEEPESHWGLTQRFYYHLIGNQAVSKRKGIVKEVRFEESNEEEIYKIEIVRKVFEEFGLSPDSYAPVTQKNLATICKDSLQMKKLGADDVLVMMFSIESTKWKDFTPAILNWFIQDFCNSKELPASTPHFYFFLAIIYIEEASAKTPSWQFWKKGNPTAKDKFLQAVQNQSHIYLIPELEKVKASYIDEWIREHQVRETKDERNQLVKSLFGEQEAHSMDKIQKELKRLIEEINNK